MGANNSTRRVSFEADEREAITVVKGIRLSENVINRMREPADGPWPNAHPHTATPSPPTQAPSPPLHPIPPPFDPVTTLSTPLVEPIAPPVAPPPAPTATETVAPAPSLMEQPPVEPVAPASVPEPSGAPESVPFAPPPAASPVDEEALRKKIADELYKGLQQEREKAEQELQGWLEEEKVQAAALARAEAQSQVQDQVSRILAVERVLTQDTLQQAVLRERVAAEDERVRAQIYAKQLEAREAELKKQDAFYREQVARLEERSAQFYKVTTENYHRAADQVNAKFKRYEVFPVCGDLQGQILKCYRENTGRTLQCSNIAALYLQCVNNAKQNKLRTGG